MCRLPHSPVERSRQDVFPGMDRSALEEMIPGVGHGLLCGFVWFADLSLLLLSCLGDDAIRLMAVLRRQIPVPLQYLLGRQ
jgi:hypothetical protein